MNLSSAILLSIGLFLGMLVCLDLGHRAGRRTARDPTAHKGLGTIEAAIFALLGLLLGFAFAGAMARFDTRRHLVVDETTAIDTAYLRLDLMPSGQPALRRLFRQYFEARLRVYESVTDQDRKERVAQAERLQKEIWARAIEASQSDPTETTARVVIPAINQMIDVTTARVVALSTRLPTLILFLLVVVALLSALMAGYAMAERGRRSPIHMLSYAACVAVTVYTVLDLDNPSEGLIRLDSAEAILRQLHDSIPP